MASYNFPTFKVEIQNPQVTIVGVNDNFDGECSVDILMSLGAPQANATKFGFNLLGFTYTNNWTQADIETWVPTALATYEI